jgi:predicted enzyme related to lactoylglutathione lyase
MTPFAHIGIEVANKEDVDAAAAQAEIEGCLHWPPTQMPDPVGYICAIKDPDGNVIEISWDQGVYAKALEVWG